uniref:Pentatricopeptide repeat-containing protein n=1 Tax=Kalanchoe fedtschenkoi TaxID=63787 RepID=A0A7N0UTH0_KALFE
MDFDVHSSARLLQSCSTPNSISLGKQIHLRFLKKGVLNWAVTVCNRLLQMYIRCGTAKDAVQLFDEMPQRNTFSWNTMIEGHLKLGEHRKALDLFTIMPDKNEFSWNAVITGFVKLGELGVARGLFDEMPRRNGVVWNSIIHGYAQNGCPREAVRLFKVLSSDPVEESRSDRFVMATLVGACTDLELLHSGKQIHARIIIDNLDFDSVLASSLINFYAKNGDLYSASHVFEKMDELNDFCLSALITGYCNVGRMKDARRVFKMKHNACVVLWNSLIGGHVSNNLEEDAFCLLKEMRRNNVREDHSTLATILSACSCLGLLTSGQQIHGSACKIGVVEDLVVVSALIDMYSKCRSPEDACKLYGELNAHDTILHNTMITAYASCGRVEEAKFIFETMPIKSLVSWNSMIVAYSQNGRPFDALSLFFEMNKLNLKMDEFSLASVISSCSNISAAELGEQVFSKAIVCGLALDQIVSASLVDFYCKCGYVNKGRKLFDEMKKFDEVPWNSMLMGYASNGHGSEALGLFHDMRCAAVTPTEITFTGVLSACDHCGLVDEGRYWFNAMRTDYDINPSIEHYSCMIDLLARAGLLEEAINCVKFMPFKVDESMLLSVLRGCVAHGNKSLGENLAEQIIQLDPKNSSAYVQLCSMFATSEDWDMSARLRKVMRDGQIQKNPGYSWAAG